MGLLDIAICGYLLLLTQENMRSDYHSFDSINVGWCQVSLADRVQTSVKDCFYWSCLSCTRFIMRECVCLCSLFMLIFSLSYIVFCMFLIPCLYFFPYLFLSLFQYSLVSFMHPSIHSLTVLLMNYSVNSFTHSFSPVFPLRL